MRTIFLTILLLLLTVSTASCTNPNYYARQSEINSAIVGGVTGGVLGGVLGNNLGDGNNQVLGAAIGTAAGAWVGQQYGQGQDQTRQRIENIEQENAQDAVIIKNTNGSFTPVSINKLDNGQYRGPKGEIYTGRPTEEQLKPVYGF